MSAEDAIDRADRYLKTADLLLDDGDYASSISRAYYAMFYVARALLKQEGSTPDTHSGLRNQFGLHLVKEGPLSDRFAQMLNDAEEMRALAEYAEGFVVNEDDAIATLQDAKEFVEWGSKLLRSS